MSKTISEKLRDIAGWIEEGREIEYRVENGPIWQTSDVCRNHETSINVYESSEYRAKPEKPMKIQVWADHVTGKSVTNSIEGAFLELTPEVREALKEAGIEL